MDTPPLATATRAQVQLIPQLEKDGSVALVALIKQRFEVNPDGRTQAVEGAEIRLADELWNKDAPDRSSVRLPADICLRKPSTDVLVCGSAVAPGRAPTKTLEVSLRVGPVVRRIQVFGLRVWYRALTGYALSEPRPFEEVPLRWELAYGGFDDSDPQQLLEEPRNPVGRGLARDPARLLNTPGPAIEDPAELIKNHRARPTPSGVGPLGRHWMPRRSFMGTYDEKWKRERVPLLPLDFDERYHQLAPPPLIAPSPLKGGEPVELVNLSEEGPLKFNLPRLSYVVGVATRGAMTEHRPMLDTVLLFPGTRAFELTWRSTFPSPLGRNAVTQVEIEEKEFQ
jgi:hypothetical protein